jgi:putative DNA primase/helicase
MKGVRLVPYRLNEWIDGSLLLIAEGERKVDALCDLGWYATCNTGGAGKFPKGFAHYFDGCNVVLLPDNDDAGRNHMRQVAAILKPVAASIRILELPGLPPKGDIIDWLKAGGTEPELRALIDGAPYADEVMAKWREEKEDAAKDDGDARLEQLVKQA